MRRKHHPAELYLCLHPSSCLCVRTLPSLFSTYHTLLWFNYICIHTQPSSSISNGKYTDLFFDSITHKRRSRKPAKFLEKGRSLVGDAYNDNRPENDRTCERSLYIVLNVGAKKDFVGKNFNPNAAIWP